MNQRSSFALILLASLVSCSEFSKPNADEAKTNFQKRYPEAEVVDMRMSEDEVVARSFEFTYRKMGSQETKRIDIQFMSAESGSFEMRPNPPKELP